MLHLGWTFNPGLLFVNLYFYIFNQSLHGVGIPGGQAMNSSPAASPARWQQCGDNTFMKLIFTLIATFVFKVSYSQTELLKDFYPENKLYKTLKVKKVVDSFYVNYPSIRTKFFDTSGRLIGEYNYFLDSIENPFIYVEIKDTLYRLKYKYPHKDLYSFERFVFNSNKKIVEYTECRNSYNGDNTILVNLHLFTYDKANRLLQQIIYRSWNYLEKVRERMNIGIKNLEFIDKYSYKHFQAKGNLMIIANHNNGNSIDTLRFNSKQQLIKQSLFSRIGPLGDRSGKNINRVTEWTYKTSSILEVYFTTYCAILTANGQCMLEELDGGGKSKEESYFEKNGLMKERYYYLLDGTKTLTDKYFYTFSK
ncbi:MAG: hypothetical protein IPI88_15555 [Chitinophagaceae bacterium]|nr:hypothetical protein [Chitinophagaceae bacterium]